MRPSMESSSSDASVLKLRRPFPPSGNDLRTRFMVTACLLRGNRETRGKRTYSEWIIFFFLILGWVILVKLRDMAIHRHYKLCFGALPKVLMDSTNWQSDYRCL